MPATLKSASSETAVYSIVESHESTKARKPSLRADFAFSRFRGEMSGTARLEVVLHSESILPGAF
jgi:hypothetical protein